MERRTGRGHLRVVQAKTKAKASARAQVRGAVAAAVAAGMAVALLTGCGKGPAEAAVADPVAPAAPGAVAASPGADRTCPVIDPTAPQSPPVLIDGSPANTPEGERLSQAIGAQGYGAFADVYATQIVDHPAGRVALCVTDLARGRLLVEAAHAADPEADPARADLYLSKYSHRTLRAAGEKLNDLKTKFPIYSISGSHGAAVEVTTTEEGAASAEFKAQLEKATGGIPVAVTKGEQATTLEGPMMTAAP
ncbi:hypothetical protein M8Z33_01475 [Streptomyces sp. ZAF1911]|uniref:hypothetical protein n=1 Tax=Streptomyces sp. ZAF1911 TaxID=2944129 RepID=UPI00237B3AFB|nr:hypothetical protein [Streptomyces sp. ZAF1911]MDD9375359.1 hypothetical protein [Streptomyces sp. ZAF1911]